ncbi:MAG: amidohydrolase family protein [Planctomycetota bacterium]|nr:amidohydrolase family protein [Planctomycetota bacterium]
MHKIKNQSGRFEKQLKKFRRQLEAFVPHNSFDVHAHLYRGTDAPSCLPTHIRNKDGDVDWDAWQQSSSTCLGESLSVAGLFFAFPAPKVDFNAANQFVLSQVQNHADCRMLLLIHPSDSPTYFLAKCKSKTIAGFKVYHVYADRADTLQSTPNEFTPEWAWQVANEQELVIMLHLVRDLALSDEANQKYIRSHCLRYPSAKLILAHAARGFCAAHTVEGIHALRGLDNIFFDTSAVCETPALEAILQLFGVERLMFGTDFPVSETVGRCVSIGDSFIWINETHVASNSLPSACPTLVGIESLLAIQLACRNLRVTDSDVERIFCTNARRLLGLEDSEVRIPIEPPASQKYEKTNGKN